MARNDALPRWSGSLCVPTSKNPIAADLARDEMQHLERRAVGPLEILEHDEQRTLRGEAREELREVPEQARLELGRIAARARDDGRVP